MKFDPAEVFGAVAFREAAGALSRPLVVFQMVFLALIAAGKFAGPASPFPDVYWMFSDPTLFVDDLVLNDSAIVKGTAFFALIHALGIKLELSVHALAFHMVFSLVSVVFCVRILLRHFAIPTIETSLAIVIVASFLTNEFFRSTDASVLWSSSANPYFLAHALTFPFLYFLLADRFLPAAGFLFAALFISLPETFLLVAMTGVYVLLHPGARRRSALFLLLPAAYLVYRLLNSHVPPMSTAQAVDLTREIIGFSSFHDILYVRQGWESATILIATFLAFPFVVRKLEAPSVRVFAWAAWICSVVIFSAQIAYTQYLYEYFPSPFFLYLFLSNPLNLYSLFFALAALAIAFRIPSLGWHEKLAVCMFFVLLHGDFRSLLIAAVFPILFIVLPRIVQRIAGAGFGKAGAISRVSNWMETFRPPMVVTLVLFAYFVVRIPTSFSGFNLDVPSFRHLGFWTNSEFFSEGTWQSYKALATIPENFPLVAVYRPYQRIGADYKMPSTFLNIVARKTRVVPYEEHALFNVDVLRMIGMRAKIFKKTIDSINARQEISSDAVEFLRTSGIRVMVPAAVADLFPRPASKRQFDEMILIEY